MLLKIRMLRVHFQNGLGWIAGRDSDDVPTVQGSPFWKWTLNIHNFHNIPEHSKNSRLRRVQSSRNSYESIGVAARAISAPSNKLEPHCLVQHPALLVPTSCSALSTVFTTTRGCSTAARMADACAACRTAATVMLSKIRHGETPAA